MHRVVLARPKVKAVVMDKDDPDKRILLLEESVCGLGKLYIHQVLMSSFCRLPLEEDRDLYQSCNNSHLLL